MGFGIGCVSIGTALMTTAVSKGPAGPVGALSSLDGVIYAILYAILN
jgi:hypothetical protein